MQGPCESATAHNYLDYDPQREKTGENMLFHTPSDTFSHLCSAHEHNT